MAAPAGGLIHRNTASQYWRDIALLFPTIFPLASIGGDV
jgi:hypothetical protein